MATVVVGIALTAGVIVLVVLMFHFQNELNTVKIDCTFDEISTADRYTGTEAEARAAIVDGRLDRLERRECR